MKRTIRSLALLLALAVSFTACKKDSNDDGIAQNTFTYNGKSYTTIYGRNEVYDNGSYSNFLLISGDISSPTFTGKISGINLLFDNAAVTEGTYTYKKEDDPSFDKKKNFFDAVVFVDMNFPDFEGGELNDAIKAGTVTISKNGTGFNVTYNLDFDGKQVSGKYSGPIAELK